jgi:O-antigen ligase
MLTYLGASLAVLALVINTGLGINLSIFSGSSAFLVAGVSGVVRATGPYGSPSAYGAVMIVCIAATLYLIQSEKLYLWGGLAFAVEVVSLAPTLTKSVWSAAFVGIIVAIGLRRRLTSRVLAVGVGAVVAALIVYSFVGESQIVIARTTGRASKENVDSRVGAWEQGLLMFKRWPLTGAGAGQFINAQALVRQVTVNGVPAATSPHNTEIAVLGETGLVGTSVLLALVYMMARLIRYWHTGAETEEEVLFGATVLAAVVGYVLLSQTFGEIYDPPSSLFIALILGALAGRINHKAVQRGGDGPTRVLDPRERSREGSGFMLGRMQ